MKRFGFLLAPVLFSLLLTSCGSSEGVKPSTDLTQQTNESPATPGGEISSKKPLENHNGTCHANLLGDVTGTITNWQSGARISGASVSFGNSCPYGGVATTDVNGNYLIRNLPQGTYNVTVSKTGYVTLNTSTSITGLMTNLRNFTLTNQDAARFITETYPDNTPVAINTNFTKMWRVQNIGNRTWTTSYYWEYVSGPMSTGPTPLYLNRSVAPGDTYDFTVPMRTPGSAGTYRDEWRFKNPSGAIIYVDYSPIVWAVIVAVVPPNNPPNDCTLVSPPHGAGGQPLNVILDWDCSDPDPGDSIVDYYLQLDDNSDFSSPLVNRYLGSSASAWQPSANGIALNYSTTYYWRVFGRDTHGAISRLWYTWIFTSDRPPTAAITSPPSGMTVTTSSVNVGGTCQDPDGNLSSATIRNDTSGWSTSFGLSGGSASFSGDVPLSLRGNSVSLICTDTVGVSANTSISVNRICPDGSQPDDVRDPCNHNDNGTLQMNGSPVSESVPEGSINQLRQFNVTNTGSGTLTYTLQPEVQAQWVNVVKNGGETDGLNLNRSHTLLPGGTDTYRVALNAAGVAPGQNVATSLRATNYYAHENSDARSVNMSVQQPPYCPVGPAACTVPPSQKLGPQQQKTSATVKDPINTATGNYSYHHTDLVMSGRGLPLSFARTYNSQDKYLGPLGIGWTHTFNIVLTEVSDQSVQIKWGDGHTEIFARNGDGSYSAPTGVFSTLTKNGDGSFSLQTKDQTAFAFGSNGQLQTVTDRKGNTVTLAYDNDNLKRLRTVADGTGKSLTLGYTGDDLKIGSVTDSAGRVVQFAYDGANQLVRFTDPLSLSMQYDYNPQSDLILVTDPRGNPLVRNTYDPSSRVTEQRDARGNLTSLAYTQPDPSQGQVVTVTDPLRQTVVQRYNGSLAIAENQDPAGRVIRYQYNADLLRTNVTDRNLQNLTAVYDSFGNLTSLTDPLNAVTQFQYDNPAIGDLNRLILPNGYPRNFEYDAEGNLTRVYETVAGILIQSRYTYNEWGQVTQSTDPEENVTTFNYDPATGNLESITDAERGVTRFTYDAAGRIESITDPMRRRVQYRYDADDRITQVTDPEGQMVHDNYDDLNGRLTVIDRNNNPTTLVWNENDFLSSIEDALHGVTAINYDPLNRKDSITDAENRTIGFTYNAQGNLESISDPDPLRRRVEFRYDFEGNPTSKIDAAGQTWTYRRDPLGRLSDLVDPLGNTTHYDFNPVTGTLTQITDAETRVTHFNYDEMGRLTSVVDPLNQTTSYEYDRAGRLTALVNAARNRTTFTYDRTGRLSTQVNALGETEQYFYNLAGDLNRFVDGIGQETIYNYDPTSGRLSSIDYADRSRVSYTYDPNGNRQTRADALGTSTFVYDALSRLTSLQEARGFTIGYDYDRTGLLTGLTYPGNRVVQYGHNRSGQLSSVTDWLGNATAYNYDPPSGRLSGVTYPNNFQASYGYDNASRLTNLTNRKADGSTLSSYGFTLNRIGNRTQVVKDEPLIPQILGENVSANYNQENELLSMAASLFDYDFNGSLSTVTAAGVPTNYDFDAKDRLSSVTGPSGTTAFAYDGDGNRVSLTAGGQTTNFVVDPNRSLPDVIAEADGAGAIQNYYLYGLGLVAKASADGSQVHYYHYDPIGSTIALSDASGAVTDQYLYDEFGQLNRSTGNTPNPFQYVGQFGVQRDPTGLNFMRARYYDPAAGRFISRDPIGFAGGMNLYGYVGSNPISGLDPSGLFDLRSGCAYTPSYCPAGNSSIMGNLTKINEDYLSPASGGLWITQSLLKLEAYRKVGLSLKPFPFEPEIIGLRNSIGTFQGMVNPETADLLKLNRGLDKFNLVLTAVDVGITTVDEYPRTRRSLDQIHSSGLSDYAQGGGEILDLGLLGGRVAAKEVTGFAKALSKLVQITKYANVAYWNDRLYGFNQFDSAYQGVDQWVENRDKDIDWWTASNVRDAVQNSLFGTQDLSGGVSPPGKR